MSKTAANDSTVDNNSTKKSDLVDKVLKLQRIIREKEEKLASEQALRSEFQSLINFSERSEQAAAGKQSEQPEQQQKSGNKRRK